MKMTILTTEPKLWVPSILSQIQCLWSVERLMKIFIYHCVTLYSFINEKACSQICFSQQLCSNADSGMCLGKTFIKVKKISLEFRPEFITAICISFSCKVGSPSSYDTSKVSKCSILIKTHRPANIPNTLCVFYNHNIFWKFVKWHSLIIHKL